MSRPCVIAMISCEGREEITARTLFEFEHIGGGHRCGSEKVLFWQGTNYPPDHMGFQLDWRMEPRDNRPRQAVWRMFRQLVGNFAGHDLVFCEDDISPAADAVPYVVMWDSLNFTTFFNTRGWKPGLKTVDNSGFWGTQCVKIPWHIFERMARENEDDPKWLRTPAGRVDKVGPYDIVMGRMLQAWALPFYQHQSLFQHVGAKSLASPGATLRGIRSARDFDPLALKKEDR